MHGVLYLAHDRPHRWREVDLEAAEALAGDAAIAVRSARTSDGWRPGRRSSSRSSSSARGCAGISDVREIGKRSRPSCAS